jgi:plasmid stabilization system protein ParE
VFAAVFTPAARAELIDAQDWYEGEASGLGRRFQSEIDCAVERMTANPLQFPTVFKNVRRALVRRFPYALFFTIEGDTLLVIACFHASRDPRQWQQRTSP